MADFSLTEIIKATGGRVANACGGKMFLGISTDTRTIKSGSLFIALVGEKFDAHEFVSQAAEKGAAGVVVSRPVQVSGDIAVIEVENTRTALQDIARFHRQRFNIPVIAVTGSNGKTTTKDMVAAVLSSRFNVLKTEANFNNEIGLPLTLLKLESRHDVAVVEMGMRARGEIQELAAIALPTVGIVTNVGETHMEILGSIENIAAAKGELVEAIAHDDLVVLNADDPRVCAMQEKAQGRVVLYGLNEKAFVRADNIASGQDGELKTEFDCCSPRGSFHVVLPTIGIHNVYNALAAMTVGWELGLKPSEIKTGIGCYVPGAMRLEVKKYKDYTVINDVYNASPLSMTAALTTLSTLATGRKIVVLGDMLELGNAAVEAHRRIGRQAAELGTDFVLTVGELAKHIADAAREHGVKNVYAFSEHKEAIEALRNLVHPGDFILLKGSRGMKMENMLEAFKDIAL